MSLKRRNFKESTERTSLRSSDHRDRLKQSHEANTHMNIRTTALIRLLRPPTADSQ